MGDPSQAAAAAPPSPPADEPVDAAAAEAAAVAEEVRAVQAAVDADTGAFAGERLDDMTNIDIIRLVTAEGCLGAAAGAAHAPATTVTSLRHDYRSYPVFVSKIRALMARYGGIRRVRSDGNCFFRATAFGLLEWLLVNDADAECQKFLHTLDACKQRMVGAGFDPMVFEDALDMLVGQVNAICVGAAVPGQGADMGTLLANFRDDTVSNMIVMLMRFVTSAEIQARQEHFAPFVLGVADMDVPDFCRRFVEPMAEESDHLHAQALCDALQVPITIVYLDSHERGLGGAGGGGSGGAECEVHRFEPSPDGAGALAAAAGSGGAGGAAGGRKPSVHLLYRPGHYDVACCAKW
ncbi:ubiquitin thioesterase protein OTUB1 [Monoraphidium neglectum]|uniref:ubiquitinyl hydrolase 1 n=1 Tax=Monoraphidium neglectum TaxID=145388 RepID=A0A0D2N0I9_9CHLO|nr:ubiquitin thioesterase protein OTUB1 [Monoraphidium neglectum]KIZ06062.1 ubiquitin thioesterase protein OTUB1 [Monoraphidium neglectum]|eukprot:XP_013905081.1 ubiquitin thioesterase protein OTUB1 [Monoraphidium neglectum]